MSLEWLKYLISPVKRFQIPEKMSADQICPVKSGTGRYPNVNLNSISLYKGVFIQPLEDKFFILIKSDSDTAATSYKTTSTGSTALRQMSEITKVYSES